MNEQALYQLYQQNMQQPYFKLHYVPYEIDVPENFLQQEWQYRSGGKVKLIKRKI